MLDQALHRVELHCARTFQRTKWPFIPLLLLVCGVTGVAIYLEDVLVGVESCLSDLSFGLKDHWGSRFHCLANLTLVNSKHGFFHFLSQLLTFVDD